ncbi:MAG: YjbE family putative metal transport protein [Rubrivivax sp.]|nr:YjbE family putative metal transport protein [Rubrivivax sp.]
MDMFLSVDFWAAVGQIILIDILLGGDNAVVIALACRSLPAAQRTQGILWGTAGAIVLRVILIFFALTLLAIPFIKLVGGALLLWIGIKLLLPDHGGEGHGNIAASDKLWGAVKTVIVADFVMSLDNVIAIAGAAEGAGAANTMPLVIFGLVVSIPIIVWGSQLVIKLMDRYPVIITGGGMLLGWIAGTMAISDPALARWVPTLPPDGSGPPDVVPLWHYAAGAAGTLFVLALGRWLAARAAAARGPAVAVAAAAAGPGKALIRRVAVAIDGSAGAERALQRALALRDDVRSGGDLELHLINVQRPLSSEVTRFIAGRTVEDYQRERGDKALEPAHQAAVAQGAKVQAHRRIGEPGAVLSELARSLGCDLIVMGARGLGAHTAALLGSVAQDTIARSEMPVLVVK